MPIDEVIREELEKMQNGNELSLKPVSEAISAGKLDPDRARSALRSYLRSRIPDFQRMINGGKDKDYWETELRNAEYALEDLKENRDITYKGLAFNLPQK